MFEHRNSGKNRRKRINHFFENLPRAYKVFLYVKKIHACVPLKETEQKYWHPVVLLQEHLHKKICPSIQDNYT
jgi:hypothetical protein